MLKLLQIFADSACYMITINNMEDTIHQGRTDHLETETRALPQGPGSVGGPMRCPWYLFHRLF
ncbi:unnamed protein product [Staurois parvus]|uniref:Uncharacterized protein n=1 Tax=Staurois parvus TaxID=386267 RepID=A0ABN9GR12_9NEOB|nr:unnamed protein product [Staurois parvus]